MCLGQAPVIEKDFFANGTFEAMCTSPVKVTEASIEINTHLNQQY
jgi:hypothetical protein